MKRKISLLIGLLAASMMLSSCGGTTTTETPAGDKPAETTATKAPAADEKTEEAKADKEDDSKKEDGKKLDIALISKGFQHQFWQAVKQGAEEAAAENNATITFEGPAAETEVEAQLTMLQTAIDRKPDAIGFAALDPKACVQLLDKAKEAGIPVIGFDTRCDSDVPATFAATDNLVAGATAADHMAKAIGEKGTVGIVGHSQVASTGVERVKGFVDRMKEKYPNIKLLDPQYGDGDHLKSADIAKSIITANPDIVGIYGTNEGAAIGVINGVKEMKLEKSPIIVGFDSGKGQIDAIKDGTLYGAVTQDPVGIGRLTVESAIKAINGEKLPEVQDTGSYWYDKENIDDPKIKAALYE